MTQARSDLQVYDRTAINVWQDRRVVDLIKQSGRKKIIIGGLWTASCVMLPALSALGEDMRFIFCRTSPATLRQTAKTTPCSA